MFGCRSVSRVPSAGSGSPRILAVVSGVDCDKPVCSKSVDTFVTPLDREDIHALARSLDDVMDAIDASATIVRLYHIDSVRPGARELTRLVRDSAVQVVCAIKALDKRKGVAECAIEINRLENEADRAHQAAVSALFKDEKDAIVIMKWKEILDFLEQATDRCEDVANVLEGVVVKHA